jgi:hypothetical protein
MTTLVATLATVLGWGAAVLLLRETGTVLAVPALAGWSLSTVLGLDVARSRERVPAWITAALVAAAGLFVALAVLAR